ncbi:MAG: methylated-DNA--[protein]-cysteine S-methyltransferase [Lutibacter sp.]
MESNQTTYYKSPIGIAKITGNENGISSVAVLDEEIKIPTEIPSSLKNCVTQLDEYFNGKRTEFNLKLNPQGTEFQKEIWELLQKIPFGATKSYLELSKDFGNTKTIRAVAAANGKNPIWIIIPCHRVIGSNGSLTGYAGGLWRKKWLLNHENPIKQTSLF